MWSFSCLDHWFYLPAWETIVYTHIHMHVWYMQTSLTIHNDFWPVYLWFCVIIHYSFVVYIFFLLAAVNSHCTPSNSFHCFQSDSLWLQFNVASQCPLPEKKKQQTNQKQKQNRNQLKVHLVIYRAFPDERAPVSSLSHYCIPSHSQAHLSRVTFSSISERFLTTFSFGWCRPMKYNWNECHRSKHRKANLHPVWYFLN